MATLTTKSGNPANVIATEYQSLMAMTCVEALRARALDLVVGKPGISPKNAKAFERTVRTSPTLPKLQGYLSNFILKADGLGVI